MINDLEFAGWQAARVTPFLGLEWSAKPWVPTVIRFLEGPRSLAA